MWNVYFLVVLAILAGLYITYLFLPLIAAIALNGVIIFLVGYRAYYEIKVGYLKQEIVGVVLSAIVVFWLLSSIAGRLGIIWPFTIFAVLGILIANAVRMVWKK